MRSLADVVHKEDFVDQGSEYLETLLVAVPRLVTSSTAEAEDGESSRTDVLEYRKS